MRIKIKEVEKIKGAVDGSCEQVNRSNFIVRIAERRIKNPDDYLTTLVHEMLHFGFTRLRKKFKIRIGVKKEHRLINKMEEAIVNIFINDCLKPKKWKKTN